MATINQTIGPNVVRNEVAKIFSRLEGKQIRPNQVTQIIGQGSMNEVFESKESPHILRLSDEPSALAGYEREKWAMKIGRSLGLPVPELVENGVIRERIAYSAQRKMPGMSILQFGGDQVPLWGQVGAFAKTLHSKHVPGGESFMSERIFKFSAALEALAPLKRGIVTAKDEKLLHAGLKQIQAQPAESVLMHGDLALRNILVDKNGKLTALLDWGLSKLGIPLYDLVFAIGEANLGVQNSFLDGYDLKSAERKQTLKLITSFHALQMLVRFQSAAKEAQPLIMSRALSGLEEALHRLRFEGR